jgi:hypothetical protein
LGALAPFLLKGAVKAEVFLLPSSPTKPNDNSTTLVVPVPAKAASLPSSSSSPTNPNPPPDQARSLAKPLFVAQVPSQIAQVDKQRTAPPLPENYRIGADEINKLQGRIDGNNRELTEDLENHNRTQNQRLQDILKRRK